METRRPPRPHAPSQRRRPSPQGQSFNDRPKLGDGRSGNRFSHSNSENHGNQISPGPSWRPKRGDQNFGPKKYGNAQKTRPRPQKRWQNNDDIKIVSDLQVTDGKYKGQTLLPLAAAGFEPIPRRLRESVFRVLGRRARAARILDICPANGTMGLEALSRGAMCVTFVERSMKACAVIKKNLDLCGIRDGRCEIAPLEALAFLARAKKYRKFWDVVYFGPPYDTDYSEYLKYFGNGVSIRPGGVLLFEHGTDVKLPETIGLLIQKRVIVQNDATVSCYERK